jgi:hypothetical protein
MKMKIRSKISIAATASLAVGALAFTLPSLAHDAQGPNSANPGIEHGMRGERPNASEMREEHSFATLSATITGIPAAVTELREAVKGANYEVFRLEGQATEVPATKPTSGGHVIGVRPAVIVNGDLVRPEIKAGEVTGNLVFRATDAEGVQVFAIYPSDDSSPILVTVTTDAAGVAAASAAETLSLSYDADAAASFAPRGDKPGKSGGPHGKLGMNGDRDHGPQHKDLAD